MNDIQTTYQAWYGQDEEFRQAYLSKRLAQYERLSNIAVGTGARKILDIGCSYGWMVEMCNMKGVDTWGVDFPLDTLQEFHKNLSLSKGKFMYGTVNDLDFLDEINAQNFELITLIHTLAHIEEYAHLKRLKPRWFLIKDVADNPFIRYKRRKMPDVHLWTPMDTLKFFSDYRARSIWASKFIFKIENPGPLALRLINQMPSYTILLERRESA
ncbi:MAG: class I SAM-dependent methyltransferase [Fimbriimonadia bacterium]|nr:class I SAM-dependent methyltransferase [Fimbriimonadia bacterium]